MRGRTLLLIGAAGAAVFFVCCFGFVFVGTLTGALPTPTARAVAQATQSRGGAAVATATPNAAATADAASTREAQTTATAEARAAQTATALEALEGRRASVDGTYTTRVVVGGIMSWKFTVTNIGSQPIVGVVATTSESFNDDTVIGCIPKCTYEKGGFGAFSKFGLPGNIVPGEAMEFTVQFSPNKPGNRHVLWRLTDADGKALLGESGKEVTLTGDVAVLAR